MLFDLFEHFLVFCSQGYLKALGMGRTAEVHRDARIGEAEAKKLSGIKVVMLINSVTLTTYCTKDDCRDRMFKFYLLYQRCLCFSCYL